MLKFRDANELDFGEICKLIKTKQEMFLVYPKGSFPLTPEQLQQLSTLRKELTVAVNNNHITGFANLYDFEQDKYAFIGNVIIKQEHRGMGYGRLLISHMLKQAFEKYSLPEVRISVFNQNTPALLLYSRFGFEPYMIEERIDSDNNKVALIHMKLARHNTSTF